MHKIQRFLLCTFIFFIPISGRAKGLGPEEEKMLAFVKDHGAEAEQLLEKVVNINSGTMNQSGVTEVGKIFQEEFNRLGFQTRWIGMPESMNRAGHLFAEKKGT